MKRWLLICLMITGTQVVQAQDSSTLPKEITLHGYFKDLQSLSFDKTFRELTAGNLIHNRVNMKWEPSNKIQAVVELRNRLIWGEAVEITPGYTSLLRNAHEKLNMQKAWIDNGSLVLHTNVERLYVDYRKTAWNLRLGRQRINWGITTNWKPNDIFNTYNFLDFDYEERPGVDGVKGSYHFKNAANMELAYINTGKKNGHVSALKYLVNKWQYDLQLLAGWYKDHPTAGAGWAGNIRDAGFKGEVQYFFGGRDAVSHLNVSLEGDYMFKKGWYINAGMLYNKRGIYTPLTNGGYLNLELSPENLMPTKWNLMVSAAKEISPLLSANMSVLYAPGTNLLILFPSLQYNLATNLDMNLVWQSFFAELDSGFEAVNHHGFLRLKWSF